MKRLRIKRLPAIAIASFVAALRAAGLLVGGLLDAVYFPTLFGRRVEVANDASTSLAVLAYNYVVPVILAWVTGFLVCSAFNALARTGRMGFTLAVEE